MKKILVVMVIFFITFFKAQADENLILAFDVSASHFSCKEALKDNYAKALNLLSPQNLENKGFDKVIILTFASDVDVSEVDLHCDNCNKRFYKQKSKELIQVLDKQIREEYKKVKTFGYNDLRVKRDIWATIRHVSQIADRHSSDKNYIYVIGGVLQEVNSPNNDLITFYTGENAVHIPSGVKIFKIFGKGEEVCRYHNLTTKDFGYVNLKNQIFLIVDNRKKLEIDFNY